MFIFSLLTRGAEQVPLIKVVNGVEEVFVLLSARWITNTCFGSIILRVSNVRLFIREKIRLVSWHTTTIETKTHLSIKIEIKRQVLKSNPQGPADSSRIRGCLEENFFP